MTDEKFGDLDIKYSWSNKQTDGQIVMDEMLFRSIYLHKVKSSILRILLG